MDVGKVLDVIPSSVQSVLGAAILSQLSGLIRIDHPMTHEFAVEIQGVLDTGYVSAEGLSDRATPFEISSVTSGSKKPVYPYSRKIGKVTVKKGITYQGVLEQWYYKCQGWQVGQPSPLKDVDFIQLQRLPKSIPYLGGQLVEIKRWSYPKCVCDDYTAPKFDAMKDGISLNEFIIRSTKPDWIKSPSNFGLIGILLDAIQR